jgi:hypothetical protein
VPAEAFERKPMKPRDDGEENFLMLGIDAIAMLVTEAVAAKRLQPRDSLVLFAVMAKVNWRSGRASVTTRALASSLGMKESNCCQSIRRLRDEGLLARGVDRDSGNAYFLLNPRLGWVGSTQRRGHLYKLWDELTHIPKVEELGDGG